jgi:hypothetical protein
MVGPPLGSWADRIVTASLQAAEIGSAIHDFSCFAAARSHCIDDVRFFRRAFLPEGFFVIFEDS